LFCRFEKKSRCLLPTALGLGWALPWLAGHGLCWLAAGALAGWPWLAGCGHGWLAKTALACWPWQAMYSYK